MKQRKRWAIFGYVTVARAACTRHFQPVVRKKKKKIKALFTGITGRIAEDEGHSTCQRQDLPESTKVL